MDLLPQLPLLQSAFVVLVLHRRADGESLLAEILARRTPMPVKEVEDKEPILPGTVYLAPADYHLLFESRELFSLDSSEKVHYCRPSIDVSFESAAEVFGPHCIGVLLSGANADGAAGLLRIREAGGYTLVQHPQTAEVGYMPQHAIALGAAVEVLEVQRLADKILKGL